MDRIREEICSSKDRLKAQKNSGATAVAAPVSPLSSDNLFCLSSDNDPIDYRDAMSRADSVGWMESIGEELQSLKDHNVFTLIPRSEVPVGHKVSLLRPFFITN